MMRIRYDLANNLSGLFVTGKSFASLKIEDVCLKLSNMGLFDQIFKILKFTGN